MPVAGLRRAPPHPVAMRRWQNSEKKLHVTTITVIKQACLNRRIHPLETTSMKCWCG
jgi:hypothetical protein